MIVQSSYVDKSVNSVGKLNQITRVTRQLNEAKGIFTI